MSTAQEERQEQEGTATTTASPPGQAQAPALGGELDHRQVLTILAGLVLGMFLSALDQTVVSTAIRTIADDLGGLSLQAWATTAFLITSTITTPLYGKLSDIYGRKPLYLLAISIFIVGSVLCTFAQSMYGLAAFRAVQGLGAGGLMSLALTILGDIVPPRQRARYQGYFLAVFGTSSVLGPVIGGVLSGRPEIAGIAGWRWIFLVNVPIGILALAVVAKVLNVPHTSRPHRIDWPGALTLAVFLVPLLILVEQGREWGWASTTALVCYGIGAVGLVLFLLAERAYGDDALLPLRLFRGGVFALSSVASVVIGMGMFGGIALLPQFLQIVHGATPTEAGLLVVPLVGGIMLASVVAGQVTSRTGRYKAFPVIGTLLMIGAMLLLHFRVTVDIPLWELDLYMGMFGVGLGSCLQTLVLAVQNAVPPRDMGVATGSATFFRQLGGTLGTAIFLSIVFSTVSDNITNALRGAAATPQFQAALADPVLRGNPADRPVITAVANGGDGGLASAVLTDSSFLQALDPRLARPFLVGFTESMTLTFLVAACVIVLAFVVVIFIREVPLRSVSGARAQALEEAGLAEAPAEVAVATEAAPASPSNGQRVGRHALEADDPDRHAASNGNGYHGPADRAAARWAVAGDDGAGAGDTESATVPLPRQRAGTRNAVGHDIGVPAARVDGPAVYGIVRRDGGAALGEAVVTVADPTGRQEARTTTRPDGSYRVALRSGGTYLVVAAAPPYQPHATLVPVADQPVRYDVALRGTGGVHGVVHTSGGRVVAGAAVTLIDLRGDVAALATTDAQGRYALTGVPDGAYTLTAIGPAGQAVAGTVSVRPGAPVEHDLRLPQWSRLIGTVTAANTGWPVVEAVVTLVDASGTVVGSTMTGPDGVFVFDDLPEGTYTLSTGGHAGVGQVIYVAAGVQVTTAVELDTPALASEEDTVWLVPEGAR